MQRRPVLPEGLLPELRHHRRRRRARPTPTRTGSRAEPTLAAALPQPALPTATPWRALFAGIGGGGIVTSGAILAMAAHLEGRQVSTLDFTGLAQKNGAVVAHVQIGGPIDAARPNWMWCAFPWAPPT